MWTFVGGDAAEEVERAPVGAVTEKVALYALVLRICPPSFAVNGLVPAPGCDPRAGGHGRYWASGTVGDDVRYIEKDPQVGGPIFRFPLAVGDLRFVGKVVAPRRSNKVRPGSSITVDCVFAMPREQELLADDLPEEWCSSWQVLGHADGELGHMLDLELLNGDEARTARDARRTPLLLDTDYGGGPLWYRDDDDKGSWGIGLSFFSLSEPLRQRLIAWTAADYHLHYDYEDDDPEHETAWHNEGLALLAELRSELGPGYDIKFAHDLDA